VNVVDHAAAFARERIAGRGDLHTLDAFPADLWREMGDAGLLGLTMPVEYGGGGHDRRTQVAAAEVLTRHGRNLGVVTTWMSHNTLACFVVLRNADEAQRRHYLPELAAGRMAVCVAISELGAGAHPKKLRTRARRDGDDWVISGEKAYLTNGPFADLFVVLAITSEEAGRKRFSAFLVPETATGLTRTDAGAIDWLRPAFHCGLRLDEVRVPAGAMLGAEGEAYGGIAGPLREVEDVVKLGALSGGMLAQTDMLAEAARAAGGAGLDEATRTEFGALVAAGRAFRALTAAVLDAEDAGQAEEAGTLLLAARRQARHFQEAFGAFRQAVEIGPTPALDRFSNDMVQSGSVARYVQEIKLRRLADRVLGGA